MEPIQPASLGGQGYETLFTQPDVPRGKGSLRVSDILVHSPSQSIVRHPSSAFESNEPFRVVLIIPQAESCETNRANIRG